MVLGRMIEGMSLDTREVLNRCIDIRETPRMKEIVISGMNIVIGDERLLTYQVWPQQSMTRREL